MAYGKIVSTNFICVCSFHLQKLEKLLALSTPPDPNQLTLPVPVPLVRVATGAFPWDAKPLLIKVIAGDKWRQRQLHLARLQLCLAL